MSAERHREGLIRGLPDSRNRSHLRGSCLRPPGFCFRDSLSDATTRRTRGCSARPAATLVPLKAGMRKVAKAFTSLLEMHGLEQSFGTPRILSVEGLEFGSAARTRDCAECRMAELAQLGRWYAVIAAQEAERVAAAL